MSPDFHDEATVAVDDETVKLVLCPQIFEIFLEIFLGLFDSVGLPSYIVKLRSPAHP